MFSESLLCFARGEMKSLTPRQRQVLILIARGMSAAEIAQELCVGRFTVKKHVRAIHERLQARNSTQAVVIAIAEGIIEIQDAA
jgi:DNA-binding NarL/FixJ family response regulator